MRRIENRANRLSDPHHSARIADINHRRATYRDSKSGFSGPNGHSIARRVASSGADPYSSFVARSVFTRGDERGDR